MNILKKLERQSNFYISTIYISVDCVHWAHEIYISQELYIPHLQHLSPVWLSQHWAIGLYTEYSNLHQEISCSSLLLLISQHQCCDDYVTLPCTMPHYYLWLN